MRRLCSVEASTLSWGAAGAWAKVEEIADARRRAARGRYFMEFLQGVKDGTNGINGIPPGLLAERRRPDKQDGPA
jgi:hypothetical protein